MPKPVVKTIVANDPALMTGELKRIGGSQFDHWNSTLINQVNAALWTGNSNAEDRERQVVAAIAGMSAIDPQDELEGMLGAQMVTVHNAAMECFRRAMIPDQHSDARAQNLSQANKLTRSYTMLLDALNKHRGKGQQKVTVEHVHVHEGGQAIVGSVQTKGAGGERGI